MTSLFARLTRPLTVDGGLLLLRIWLGSMMISHGVGKVFGTPGKFMESVAGMGFPMPEVFAWAGALSEFAGGILLIGGLLSRPAALLGGITMAVAAFIRHADDPFGKKELALTYLVLHLVVLLAGPGRISMDSYLASRTGKDVPHS